MDIFGDIDLGGLLVNGGQINTRSKKLDKLEDINLLELIDQGDSYALDLLIHRYLNFVRLKARTYFWSAQTKKILFKRE